MTKHSRNNTANSVFSYAEYKKLSDYGTKKQRLGVDSMKRFDACSLCLQRARDPMACDQGHLYCKECIYTDLLAQKKDIKRYKAKLDDMVREEEEEKLRAKEAARDRVLRDFERGQLGLAGSVSSTAGKAAEVAVDTEVRGTKRKFTFDLDHVDALAAAAEDAALKQIEMELAESRKSKLPSAYWLASETPTAKAGGLASLKDVKLETMCKAPQHGHPLSLKNLAAVSFAIAPSSQGESSASSTPSTSSSAHVTTASQNETVICPSCKKTLGLGIIFHLRRCSHAVCNTCYDTLVKPSKQCTVCDVACPKDKDCIQLNREGTGFSAGGRAESSKAGVSFQG